jgi:hypothetical protein
MLGDGAQYKLSQLEAVTHSRPSQGDIRMVLQLRPKCLSCCRERLYLMHCASSAEKYGTLPRGRCLGSLVVQSKEGWWWSNDGGTDALDRQAWAKCRGSAVIALREHCRALSRMVVGGECLGGNRLVDGWSLLVKHRGEWVSRWSKNRRWKLEERGLFWFERKLG